MKKIMLVAFAFVFSGCIASDYMNIGKRTIYPCTIGCGNKSLTPPKGYVYYFNELMTIEEFNRMTHQNIVIE